MFESDDVASNEFPQPSAAPSISYSIKASISASPQKAESKPLSPFSSKLRLSAVEFVPSEPQSLPPISADQTIESNVPSQKELDQEAMEKWEEELRLNHPESAGTLMVLRYECLCGALNVLLYFRELPGRTVARGNK